MTLLTVENLSVAFCGAGKNHGSKEVVHGVSFSLKRGEMLALVGESGSGKSVTALSLMQLHRKDSVEYPTGAIHFEGEALLGKGETVLQTLRGARMGMVFQEPMSALNPLHKVHRQIREMIQLHSPHRSESEMTARVEELLDLVGLSDFKTRTKAYPHELSGGERQRIVIAMAIANNPDLLIADEPTTALDANLQLQIIDLIRSLQRKLGMAVLLITHDLPLVEKTADRVAIMQQGKLVEQGEVAEVFASPKHAYTQHLLASAPKGSPLPIAADAPEILSCQDLTVAFPTKTNFFGKVLAEKTAVAGSSIALKAGETLGIVGESGSGKTTLGLALLRLIASRGEICFDGKNIDNLPTKALKPLRHVMQFVFQDPFASLNPRLTIGDIVGEGLKVHHPELSKAAREENVLTMLQEVGLNADMLHRYPHEFSGGQRQRINIARAMILRPKLMVLDEPTSALDLSLQSQIIELLKALQQKYGTAYLFISHDLRVIRAISHRVSVIHRGEIVESSGTEALFAAPQHAYTQTLMKAAFGE